MIYPVDSAIRHLNNWSQEFGWDAQSRGLIKPGLGHYYSRNFRIKQVELRENARPFRGKKRTFLNNEVSVFCGSP